MNTLLKRQKYISRPLKNSVLSAIVFIASTTSSVIAWENYTAVKSYDVSFQNLISAKEIEYILGNQKYVEKCYNIYGRNNINIPPSGESFTITYPQNTYWSRSWFGSICPLPENTQYSAFSLSYILEVPSEFPLGKGIKLNGICYDECPRGWKNINNPWNSLRVHTRQSKTNTFSSYIHQQNWGNHFVDTPVTIQPWNTYAIEIFIDTQEGNIQTFLNGISLYQQQHKSFKTPLGNTDKWNIMLSSFRGGGDISWSVNQNSSLEFSDWKITYYKK